MTPRKTPTATPLALVSFRPGELASDLICRIDPACHGDTISAGAAQIARRDANRYYALLHAALPTVGLTLAEARLLVAAYNGIATAMHDREDFLVVLAMMSAEVAAALANPPLDLDGIDPTALTEKVRGWTLVQRAAVIDAIERCWIAVTQGGEESMDEIIRAVGLVPWQG